MSNLEEDRRIWPISRLLTDLSTFLIHPSSQSVRVIRSSGSSAWFYNSRYSFYQFSKGRYGGMSNIAPPDSTESIATLKSSSPRLAGFLVLLLLLLPPPTFSSSDWILVLKAAWKWNLNLNQIYLVRKILSFEDRPLILHLLLRLRQLIICLPNSISIYESYKRNGGFNWRLFRAPTTLMQLEGPACISALREPWAGCNVPVAPRTGAMTGDVGSLSLFCGIRDQRWGQSSGFYPERGPKNVAPLWWSPSAVATKTRSMMEKVDMLYAGFFYSFPQLWGLSGPLEHGRNNSLLLHDDISSRYERLKGPMKHIDAECCWMKHNRPLGDWHLTTDQHPF